MYTGNIQKRTPRYRLGAINKCKKVMKASPVRSIAEAIEIRYGKRNI